MNKLFFYACSALLASGAALTAVSCADEDLDNGGTNGKDAVVHFSVNDVQEGAISRGVMTRGAITPGLGSSDLAGDKLTAHSNRNIDVCLIETTVEGVNPVKADAHTRANIIYTSTLGDFSVSAIRGTTETSILTTPEWFHAKKTKSDGELYSPIYWAFSQPWARFFAVYPNTESYSKMTIGNTETSGSPSVDFEVDSDVKNQKDFMAACTGDVHYATRGVHPPNEPRLPPRPYGYSFCRWSEPLLEQDHRQGRDTKCRNEEQVHPFKPIQWHRRSLGPLCRHSWYSHTFWCQRKHQP